MWDPPPRPPAACSPMADGDSGRTADHARAGGAQGNAMRSLLSAVRYCVQPRYLHWTLRIALVMGVVYTVVNQADVIARGKADALVWVKIPLNFLAPFIVANVGL